MKIIKTIFLSLLFVCQISYCHADKKSDADSIKSQRSQAYALIGKKQYEPALQILKKVADQLPEDPKANMDYGGTLFASASKYFHRDRVPMFDCDALPVLQESASYLKRAAGLYGDDKESKFWKAHAYYLLGDIYQYGLIDIDEAKMMYRISLDISPDYSPAREEMESLR